MDLVGMAAGSASAMIKAGAASMLLEAIPQGIAVYIALQNWDEPCDQPLQMWLAVMGGIHLLIFVPALLILCREHQNIKETLGNEDLLLRVYSDARRTSWPMWSARIVQLRITSPLLLGHDLSGTSLACGTRVARKKASSIRRCNLLMAS